MVNQQASIESYARKLHGYLPLNTAPIIARWIVELKVLFVISKPRKTKLGDFRPPRDGSRPRISVNADLNKYNFLITTVHEFAHLGCHLKYGNKVNPHGAEWKKIYTDLLKPFVSTSVFPSDLVPVLKYHVSQPSASSCSCPKLSRAMVLYDNKPGEFLSDIELDTIFTFQDKLYKKLERRRTRYVCKRLSDERKYLISGRALVELVEPKLS